MITILFRQHDASIDLNSGFFSWEIFGRVCLWLTLAYAWQVLNGHPYNRKCDVYSFGICLWEVYCCDMPYPDLSFSEVTSAVVRQVQNDTPPSLYIPLLSLLAGMHLVPEPETRIQIFHRT
jgi:serine/threonine protein kinase